MAHGYLTPTDIRVNRNYLGAVAGAIGSRIKKSSNMAARERAYASKQAEAGGTSLEEAGIGRGYFFKRALGSSFGGDRIARTRGRFETDPGPGRDPSGTQASRFRGGFDYGVSNNIKSPTGGALANIVSPGGGGVGGGAAGFPGSGSTVINPDVLGGAMVQSQYRATTQNSNVSIDTTATEVKDLAGILNQIGQIIVSSSNSTIQAVDSVQQVNVQVVEGIKSLGQLQVRVAERQLDQQRQLAAAAEQNQMIMMSRLLSAQEARNFTEDDFSGNLTAEKGYGFGGKGGGFIGGLVNRLSDFFGMRMGPGGGGGGFRAPGGGGGAARGGGMLGGASRALGMNRGSMVNRMGGNFLARNATRMFGRGGLMPILRPIFKRIPIFGGLIDFAVSLALGEPVGRAAAKAVGATLGAGLGSLIPVPGVGTIAGGILGDFAGGAIYDAITGSGDNKKETVPQLGNGAQIKGSKNGVLVRVGEKGPGKNELVKPLDKKVFEQEEQTRIDVQHRNRKKLGIIQSEGLKQYYDKENGWEKFVKSFQRVLGGIGEGLMDNPITRGLGEIFVRMSGQDPAQLQNRRNNRDPNPYTGSGSVSADPTGKETGILSLRGSYGAPVELTSGQGIGNTFLHHGREDTRGGLKVRDYFIGSKSGPADGSDGLGANLYTPLGLGPLKYQKNGQFGINFIDPDSGNVVGKYQHVENAQHQLDGKIVQPGTVVGTQGGLPGTPSALGSSSAVHLHAEGTDDFHNALISTYAGGNILTAPATHNSPPPDPTQSQPEPPERLSATAQHLLSSRNSLTKSINAFNASIAPERFATLRNVLNKEGRNSKPEEDIRIPGVGTMRVFSGIGGSKYTYWDERTGKEMTMEEFYKKLELRKKFIQRQEKGVEAKNEALKELGIVSSAGSNPDVLQASARNDAGERAAKTQVAFLNTPMPQKQQGGSSDSSAILAAMGSASSSPSSWTPAGWHNAILDA